MATDLFNNACGTRWAPAVVLAPARRRVSFAYLGAAPFFIFAVMFLLWPTAGLIIGGFQDADGRFTGTGETQDIPVQMVLRSVGYQSVPLPGIPFDERTHTVPNTEGRVLGPDGAPLPREYVAGWLKRGPTGVIGTNKSDAAQTVRSSGLIASVQ